jgi:hypothetical protein
MNAILVGAIAMASLVIGLFFLRFWRSTKDRFFLYFALSFFLQGFNRILAVLTSMQSEDAPVFYAIRLVAYSLILFAVLGKNRRRSKIE